MDCTICLQMFNPDSDIYTAPCGHLFDYACINRWILWRSPTCPHCKAECTMNECHKVHLDIPENPEARNYENQINHLCQQIQAKDNKLRLLRTKRDEVLAEIEGHTLRIEEQRQELVVNERSLEELYATIEELQANIRTLTRKEQCAKRRLKELRNSLKDVSGVLDRFSSKVNIYKRQYHRIRRKLNSLQTGWATEKAELTNEVEEYERKLKSHGINTEFLDDAIEEMEIIPPESD